MKILSLSHTFESGKFRNKTIKQAIETDSKYLTYFLSRNADCRFDKDVIKFAQGFVNMKFNTKMVDVLTQMNSSTSNALLEMNTKLVKSIFTNVKATTKEMITFDTPFTSNKANTIKVGRFVRKIFELNDVSISDTDIEEFCTSFYSLFSLDKNYELKIVKGEEIRRLYLMENYQGTGGTLGNSCMRFNRNSESMSLYAHNSNVSMLVLMHKVTKKISGRAIVWGNSTLTFEDGKRRNLSFMDRVYNNSHKNNKLFFLYAKNNGWVYKKVQSYSSRADFIYNDKDYRGVVATKLEKISDYVPYLDTMSYICRQNNVVSNSYKEDMNDLL